MKNSRNGYCECGCGELAPIYKRTDMRIGSKAGTPAKFIVGHQARKSVSPGCGYIVDLKTGCWNWALAKGRDGYGKVKVGGRTCRSHIVEWERKNGHVPDGLYLDHLCRNVACVNPSHLEPVTPAENVRRGMSTKLTVKEVMEIKDSALSRYELALKFSICKSHLSCIKRGLGWKNTEAKK